MSERKYFERDTNYIVNSGFSRVKFGIDKPILEVELNELQKIQEEKRTSVMRQTVPSGFLELKKRDFDGEDIIYNPTITVQTEDRVRQIKKLNSVAIPPCKLIVHGFEVDLEGDVEINNVKGYTLIELKDAPNVHSSGDFFDFVFLELWFQEITATTTIYKNGFLQGGIVDNSIIDDRVEGETSRRVALRCRIRVERNINSDKWPDGFGYDEGSGEQSLIYAQGPLNEPIRDKSCIFLPATSKLFKGTNFYNDFGLFVAGRKDYVDEEGISKINKNFGVLDNYILAVPMMKIKRRNNRSYSRSNPNGGVQYIDSSSISDRPDGLFNNIIDKRDLIDLRKTVSFNQLNTNKLLDENLKKVMTGVLSTNENDKMMRAQFGLPQLSSVSTDYLSDALLHLDFTNRNLAPAIGGSPVLSGNNVDYHLSALGYGLALNGEFSLKYPLDNFNKSGGTIEFLLKPYWDGADKDISQVILSIVDSFDNPLIKIEKKQEKLIMRQYHSGGNDPIVSETLVNLKYETIYNNEIYHFRFCWSSNTRSKFTSIYINGKQVAHNNYLFSELTPRYLKLGEISTINSYSSYFKGCLIDELVLYNKALSENTFSQIDPDITYGEAKLYNSFNGILRGFQDNEDEQKIISVVSTTTNSNYFELESPFGTKIIVDNAKVYSSTTGEEYQGDWLIVNDRTVKFNLTLTPEWNQTFSGETVWIIHSIILPGGLGIKEVPTKILKAELNNNDISFSSASSNVREITGVKDEILISDFIQIKSKEMFDFGTEERDDVSAFARLLKCVVKSNGTNVYKIPKTLYGREVLGIKYINKGLSNVYKEDNGNFVVRLLDKLSFQDEFDIEIALGGFTFEYETHTKSLVSNMMKAGTVRIPTTGNKDQYVIPASLAINDNAAINPNGGIIVSFLGLKYAAQNNSTINLGKTVFISGPVKNTFLEATIEGVGTPFIKVTFKDTPPVDHFIEIPVLITYQPKSSEILSIWYEHSPYQGILTNNVEKKLRRISDWKCFATTFGSGKIVVNNIKEKSINNATNRLPGGLNFSYLLDGEDINFTNEQISIGNSYSPNKKLIFRNQFLELIKDDEFDTFSSSLTTEFSVKKKYGRNYQDAFVESSIDKIGFVIQDTDNAINKYLGAACLVTDEEGNILLFIMGEIAKDKTTKSVIKPTHGDLFKLEKNPIIIPRND